MSHETQERLDKHHRGAQFHDVMVSSFEGRFDDSFWSFWQQHVGDHHGDAPTYVDLGCGPGLMLRAWRQRFPNAQLHGVELQPYMLATARAIAKEVDGTIHAADLQTLVLDLPDHSVDAALLSMVVHEMGEPVGLMREIKRVLKPGGRLVLMDWVRVPLSQYLERFDGNVFEVEADARVRRFDHFMEHNKFSRDDLLFILSQTGFTACHEEARGGGQFIRLVLTTEA
ncbi:MAG: class I SAM-dependent methyltransferase [Bradymonadia bacterium]